ncbi:MAG TPA: DUF4249 family protein [Bacteroidetes bacterium]|nr:DUF4249 family protein [Bacteroidota bacterium]
MKYLLIFILILINFSCIDERDYELNYMGDSLVAFARGTYGKGLEIYVTKTIPPLEQKENLDDLDVNNATIILYEDDVEVNRLNSIENGLYHTTNDFSFTTGKVYNLVINVEGYPEMISDKIKMPNSSKFIDFDLDFSGIDSIDIAKTYVYEAHIKIAKNDKDACHSFNYKYYVGNISTEEGCYFEYSSNQNLNCDYCYNFLENKCITVLDSVVSSNIFIRIEDESIKLNENIDSFKFEIHTLSKSAEIACKNNFDIDSYIDFSIPLQPSPAPTYTNFKNGNGLFVLENIDSIIIKK